MQGFPWFKIDADRWAQSDLAVRGGAHVEGSLLRAMIFLWRSDCCGAPVETIDAIVAQGLTVVGRYGGHDVGDLDGVVSWIRDEFIDHPDRDGYLTHPDLYAQWQECQELRAKRRKAGLASGRARAQHSTNTCSTRVEQIEIEIESKKKTSPPVPPTGGKRSFGPSDLVEVYEEILPNLPRVRKPLSGSMKAKLNAAIRRDGKSRDRWVEYFTLVRGCPFLLGEVEPTNGRPPFKASLHWLIGPDNKAKVEAGNFMKRGSGKGEESFLDSLTDEQREEIRRLSK